MQRRANCLTVSLVFLLWPVLFLEIGGCRKAMARLDDTSLTMSSMALSRATQWCRSLQSLDLGSARLRHVAMGACEGLGRWRHALRLLPQEMG